MSNLTIAYNGSTIFDGELGGAITLPTAEKYLEGDIVIAGEGGGTVISDVLEENEWSVISKVAKSGEGGNYWNVGDTKSVLLSGTVGTLSINTTLYVYIIGINHRDTTGITFQVFKAAASSSVDVCLIDSKYNTNAGYSGGKYFQINHWGSSSSPYNTNYGGWKGCDLRYDILGSTNKAPSGYGSTATSSRVGYDAGATTATNPIANTLMSCLPSDVRSVMRPMIIYTDNRGGVNNTEADVTVSVDYLPLLAEYEIFGTRTYVNTYEQNSQAQYNYYYVGNSKIKYAHNNTDNAAIWWGRSPDYESSYNFCCVRAAGTATRGNSRASYGITLIFLV